MQYTPMNAADWLPGTWTVQATNFPLWLKGDKLAPTFTYTALDDGRLLDEVRYQRQADGSTQTITGYDRFDTATGRFIWRGKGLLFIARSEWRVLTAADDGQTAIILFSKTLFTAAGLDVIARSSDYDPAIVSYTTAALAEQGLKPSPPLKWLKES
ncbi:MAG: hypothetical protein IT321_29695 [Anaerolineae bacterium]|nr:hypothetical protein [Anaerolineae bacterium]